MFTNFGYRHFSKKAIVLVWLFLSTAVLFCAAAFGGHPARAASMEDLKQSLQQQIDELEKKIVESQQLIEQYQKQSTSLQRDVSIYNKKISQLSLEIEQMKLSIQELQFQISKKAKDIDKTEQEIDVKRAVLGKYVKEIYEREDKSLLAILLHNRQLSEVFDDLNSFDVIQANIHRAIGDIESMKDDLLDQKSDLDDQKNEMLSLKTMIDIQKRAIEGEKKNKDKLIADTKGKEAKYSNLVEENKKTLERLRQELGYLEKSGISTLDAVRHAKLAAMRTSIRPAFLLAILEIESELGVNVGRGNWRDDMYSCYIRYGKRTAAEQLKSAFFEIVEKLGLDPDSVPVSKKPDYGCGGAMGPAQFLPTTWLLYETQLEEMTGHKPPSPWNIEDSFLAAALKLAESGAAEETLRGEDRAARTYIGGRPNCTKTICNVYARRAINLAATLEEQLKNGTESDLL